MCNLSINVFGVMIAWVLMGWGIGRRSLYLYGCLAMNIVLWIVGGIGFIGTRASLWAIGGLLLGWQIGYQFTLGTVCFSLITEFPSRRLLIKTVNIGRAAYNVTNIIFGESQRTYLFSSGFLNLLIRLVHPFHDQPERLELGYQGMLQTIP